MNPFLLKPWADRSVVITDAILALGAGLAAIACVSQSAFSLYACLAFVMLAICALLGCVYHAIRLRLTSVALQRLWAVIVGCTCLFAALLTMAVQYKANGDVSAVLLWFTLPASLVLGIWGGCRDSFMPAACASLVGVALTFFSLCPSLISGEAWANHMLIGLVLSLAAGIVQMLGWRRGLEWNHNDVYHGIQLVAVYPMVLALR